MFRKIKIFIIIFSLTLVFSFSFFSARPACAWDAMAAAQYKQAAEQIWQIIQGILRGGSKQAAAQAIMQQVSSIVGGSGGSGPMYITDFRDFLIAQPINSANLYANDLISQTTGLRGSSAYEGFGNSGGGSGNYIQQLTQMAKAATSEAKPAAVTYQGNPAQMFDNGNLKDLGSFLSGINSRWAYQTMISSAYENKISDLTMINQTDSISNQAFLGARKDGKILTPGSYTKDVMVNAQDLGNKIIAGATDLPEIIFPLALTNSLRPLQSGIGPIEDYLNKAENSLTQYSGYLDTGMGAINSASKGYKAYNLTN